MEMHADSLALSPRPPPDGNAARPRRRHKATRPQLLTRAALDGRTGPARLFDRMVADVVADLGGRENVSTVEYALTEAFAGACVIMHNLNTRLLLGEQIDLSQHAQAVSAMVRVASSAWLAAQITRRLSDTGRLFGRWCCSRAP